MFETLISWFDNSVQIISAVIGIDVDSKVLPWLGVVLSIVLSYKSISYAFHSQYIRETKKKQLEKAYLPIFLVLEPILYKDVKEVGKEKLLLSLNEVEKIIQRNYVFIRPSIVHWTRWLIEKIKDEDYKDIIELDEWFKYLCMRVDEEFENTRKKLFLPTRNLTYKLNNEQFKTKKDMYLGMIRYALPQLLVLIIVGIISIILMNWIDSL